jgi:hypothetical protein
MTATIDPRAMPMVARRDPQLRLRDYEWALQGWLASGSVDRVVFCENSGYDVGSLRSIAAAHPEVEVEFLTLHDDGAGIARGKGYAELLIIAAALARSRLIEASARIVKCTGRLRVQNALRVLAAVSGSEFDVMCTLKRRGRFADSRLFVATPAFVLEHLIPRADLIDDSHGIYLEHVLARAVRSAVGAGGRWRPFPTRPRIEGISGTRGLVLTESAATSLLKACWHRLANLRHGK